MSNPLPVSVSYQLRTYWCWAAVAKGIVDLYDSTNQFSQCSIATAVLGAAKCTDCMNDDSCNSLAELQTAVTKVGHFAAKQECQPPYDDVLQITKTEIDAGRPVGARIAWQDNSGHFVLICGYSVDGSGNVGLFVADPECGFPPPGGCAGMPSITPSIPYGAFFSNYGGFGSCSHIYRTR
jgi:hypothetical protein